MSTLYFRIQQSNPLCVSVEIARMSSFIDRYSSKQFGLKKNETKPEVLKKLTHVYLNGKHIEEIVIRQRRKKKPLDHQFLICVCMCDPFSGWPFIMRKSQSSLFA